MQAKATLRFNKYLLLICVILLSLLPDIIYADTTRVKKTLKVFDASNSVATANSFFEAIHQDGFLDEEIKLPTGTTVSAMRSQVWYWAAEWYYDKQNYALAKDYALKALPLFKENNSDKAYCLNLLGILYVRLGDLTKAIVFATKSHEINKIIGDADRISSGINTLAGIYLSANRTDEAQKYILEALKYAEKADNQSRKAILLGMASEIYHKSGNDEQSLVYARKAYEIDSLQGRMSRVAVRLSQMASALNGLKRYKEAEKAYKRAIPILRKDNNLQSLAIDLNQLGYVLLAQKREKEAVPMFVEALNILKNLGDIYNQLYSHKGLYESYWKLNPDSAKIEVEAFNKLRDSLYATATAETLSRFNAEFGNRQLKEENELIRNRHRFVTASGIIIIVIIILVSIILLRRLAKKHKKQLATLIHEIEDIRDTAAENTKEDIASECITDIHNNNDFLKQVIDIVNKRLERGSCNVALIANQLNMSEQTFRRHLRNITGESPKMFISAIQMERAAHLIITETQRSISNIATSCGYEETSSFSHAFKKIYGCTPTQYRLNNKNDNS
ncbi:MAG: tetratricopeptide repeat protein [Prevotella sp.]